MSLKSFGVHLLSQIGLQSRPIQIWLYHALDSGPSVLANFFLISFLVLLTLNGVIIFIKPSPKDWFLLPEGVAFIQVKGQGNSLLPGSKRCVNCFAGLLFWLLFKLNQVQATSKELQIWY